MSTNAGSNSPSASADNAVDVEIAAIQPIHVVIGANGHNIEWRAGTARRHRDLTERLAGVAQHEGNDTVRRRRECQGGGGAVGVEDRFKVVVDGPDDVGGHGRVALNRDRIAGPGPDGQDCAGGWGSAAVERPPSPLVLRRSIDGQRCCMAVGSNGWRDESAVVGEAGRWAITPGTAVEASERSGTRLHDRCARTPSTIARDPPGLDGIGRCAERSHTAVGQPRRPYRRG